MTRAILTGADLAGLVAELVGAGTRVVAPVPVGPGLEQTEYRPIARLDEAVLDGGQPRHSLKTFFRASPREERAGTFRQVILGARPCDAAALDTLDQVMGWDYRDEEWVARRRATTVVTVACQEVAPSCFCSAVGDGPASARGADVLLLPVETDALPPQRRRIRDQLRQCVDLFLLDSQPYPDAAEVQAGGDPSALADLRFTARSLTEKGEALLRGRGAPCAEGEDERAAALARRAAERAERNAVALRRVRRRAPLGREEEARLGIQAADGGELLQPPAGDEPVLPGVADWLARNVDHEVWSQAAPRCRGCGTCAAVCSTSPCFDDAAPRRAERFRQRVIQKFSTHSRRFRGVQCTGCGRCSRGCQGGIDLPAFLGQLVQLAAPEPRMAT
jgi:ferredoxin